MYDMYQRTRTCFTCNKILFNLLTIHFRRRGIIYIRTFVQIDEFNLQQFRLRYNFAASYAVNHCPRQPRTSADVSCPIGREQVQLYAVIVKILSTGGFNVLQLSGPLNCIIVIARTRACSRCLNI
jgi:hypothetical protein